MSAKLRRQRVECTMEKGDSIDSCEGLLATLDGGPCGYRIAAIRFEECDLNHGMEDRLRAVSTHFRGEEIRMGRDE